MISGGCYILLFSDIETNKKIICGAFKKLKSYYYYDKSMLFNKLTLAVWENNYVLMDKRIAQLADFLCSLERTVDYDYLQQLFLGIELMPMPKAFDEPDKNGCGYVVQNAIPKYCTLNKVNFYIKAPVELLILDVIWTLLIGKIANDQKSISPKTYANKLRVRELYLDDENLLTSINFDSNRMFYPYFQQYAEWRNRAFKKIEERYKNQKDSILLSLDIKSYYYSVGFDFKVLDLYLCSDKRLKDIAPLTNVIRKIYLIYTTEVKKYRESVVADCKKGECIFPLGLHSSMLLANLYLTELDRKIQKQLAPAYYGRYVDDILLVIDKPPGVDIEIESILKETLIKKEIVTFIDDENYKILLPSSNSTGSMVLQKEKIKCVCFDYDEPDALIRLLNEAADIKASMSEGNLMPDIDFSEKSFHQQAYSLGDGAGVLKIRNLLFSSNNFAATLFINSLIRASKNVDIEETAHWRYINLQLKQILQFYNGGQAILYRSAWISVFTLTLMNERYDYFIRFFLQLYDAINELTATTIEFINPGKTEVLLKRIKDLLFEQLKMAMSVALAPFAIEDVKEKIIIKIGQKIVRIGDALWQDVFSNAKDIRKANLYNQHYVAFPLLNYIKYAVDGEVSLTYFDFDEITKIKLEKHVNEDDYLPLDKRKLEFSPRFIHFDELILASFLFQLVMTGETSILNKDNLIDRFLNINKLTSKLTLNAKIITDFEFKKTKNTQLCSMAVMSEINEYNKMKKDRLKVAIASIWLDEENDVTPVLKHPLYKLTPKSKKDLYRLLNEAKRNHTDMIVFPEYYLPVQWLPEILNFSRLNSIAIISGLRYIVVGKRTYNILTIIQPFAYGFYDCIYKYTLPLLREKNHYAPAEVKALKEKELDCFDPSTPYLYVIKWNNITYSNLVCYELTNILYRYILRGRIDMLLIPELNKDTAYFSSIVESTCRDLHCFVIQVNTSKYGDSRITGPYNSLFKDSIKVKGGRNSVLLLDTVDFSELHKMRKTYLVGDSHGLETEDKSTETNKQEDNRHIKKPPAGFCDERG